MPLESRVVRPRPPSNTPPPPPLAARPPVRWPEGPTVLALQRRGRGAMPALGHGEGEKGGLGGRKSGGNQRPRPLGPRSLREAFQSRRLFLPNSPPLFLRPPPSMLPSCVPLAGDKGTGGGRRRGLRAATPVRVPGHTSLLAGFPTPLQSWPRPPAPSLLSARPRPFPSRSHPLSQP